MKAAIYSETTGEIRAFIESPPDHVAIQCQDGESYVTGEGQDDTHYVDLDSYNILPKNDYTLEALALPCTVTIEGVEYYCTEQPTIEFNYPGTYKVYVDAGVKYLKKEFEVVWP